MVLCELCTPELQTVDQVAGPNVICFRGIPLWSCLSLRCGLFCSIVYPGWLHLKYWYVFTKEFYDFEIIGIKGRVYTIVCNYCSN